MKHLITSFLLFYSFGFLFMSVNIITNIKQKNIVSESFQWGTNYTTLGVSVCISFMCLIALFITNKVNKSNQSQ